jgi:hypothetical protein
MVRGWDYIPGSGPSPMIIVGPQRWNNHETSTILTADGIQGTKSVQVTSTAGFSVAGNTVIFDSPITILYRVSHQAQIYCWQTPHTRNAGIENLRYRTAMTAISSSGARIVGRRAAATISALHMVHPKP